MEENKKSLISLDQIEIGDELKTTIQEIFDKVKDIDPDSYRKITDFIKAEDLDEALYDLIMEKSVYDDTEIRNQLKILEQVKASRTELELYREKAVKIFEYDLDEDLAAKINAIIQGYDDRFVLSEIEYLKLTKLDKTDTLEFRRTYNPIKLEDLDEFLQSRIELLPEIDSGLEELYEKVITKDELKNYRLKAVSICFDDLSENLQDAVNKLVKFDAELYDFNKKLAIVMDTYATKKEMARKADKVYVDENFRKNVVPINFDDLDDNLKNILDSIAPEFDSTFLENKVAMLEKTKADKEYVDKYFRKVTEPIYESNLDPNLINKINRLVDVYDDTNVMKSINKLEEHKADLVLLQNYRLEEVPIARKDLDKEVQSILTMVEHHDQEMRQHYFDLREIKADKTELENYRKKETKIIFDDLAEAIKNRIIALENQVIERDERINELEFQTRALQLSLDEVRREIGLP